MTDRTKKAAARRTVMFAGFLAATFLTHSTAFAQADGSAGRLVYDVTFFEPYAATTALQMVERLPGFLLDSGDSSVRGFGQAAGNVVINGMRPSSKSDTLSVVLARIPASRVLRIELAPGTVFGADYAGKPQVANVVLSADGGLAATFEAKFAREFTGSVLPTLSGSAVLTRGNSSINASLKLQSFAYSEDGYDRLVALPSMEELEYREVFRDSREPYKIGSIGWAHEVAQDRSAHLNAKVSIDPWNIDQTSQIALAGGGTRKDVFVQRHTWKTYEISGDITRPLFGGAIKLNALATNRDRMHDDWSGQYSGEQSLGGSAQQLDDLLEERVGRLTWSRSQPGGWQMEFGAEAAFNRLTSETNFFAIDALGERTRVNLPIDDAIVTERRGEAFVNLGRNLASDLYLDLGLTYETSRLEVTGDVNSERSLQFWKPKASLEWSAGDWHSQLSVARTVAQLDFADFMSGAELNDDRVNGGNADLVPQSAWEFLLSADRKLLGDGRIKVDLGYDFISQVQDRVPTSDGFDAPGNLGDGWRLTARATLDLPLAPVGIRGGRLSLTGAYVDTSVTDPYTLASRHFSGGLYSAINLFAYSASLRQDLGQWGWGVDVKGNSGTTSYRRTEEDRLQSPTPNISAFVEYRPSNSFTAAIGVENALNRSTRRWRDMFTPDRTSPLPSHQEFRERSSHRIVYFSVKKSLK